jgi:hypothetical protein
MSHSYAENMDLVVIHDGTHAAKGGGGGGVVKGWNPEWDNSSLHLLVVTECW